MNTCTKCGVAKPLFDFHKDSHTKSGFRPHCKLCVHAYAQDNKETISARQKTWYEQNRETKARKSRDWYEQNREKEKAKAKRWRQANPDKANALKAKRRASKLQATPPWLTQDDLAGIRQFYTIANQLTELNGQIYHVDHIVPLQGKTVCGLHVPWNLQVLEGSENMSKSNKLVDSCV